MPYACSMCPPRFARKSAIAPHAQTYTGEKPYACSMCLVRFANKSHVAPHERNHTGKKPYGCSMCPLGPARVISVSQFLLRFAKL